MQPRSGDGTATPAATSQDGTSVTGARPDLDAPTSAHPTGRSAWMSDLQPAHPGPRFDPSVPCSPASRKARVTTSTSTCVIRRLSSLGQDRHWISPSPPRC